MKSDFLIKLVVLLKVTFFLVFYSVFLINFCEFRLLFVFFTSYFILRLIMDWFLILISLVDDGTARWCVEKISKGRILATKSWEDRVVGVDKWLLINSVVFIILFLLERLFVFVVNV